MRSCSCFPSRRKSRPRPCATGNSAVPLRSLPLRRSRPDRRLRLDSQAASLWRAAGVDPEVLMVNVEVLDASPELNETVVGLKVAVAPAGNEVALRPALNEPV